MKLLLKIVVFFAVLAGLVFVFRNQVLKAAASFGVEKVTGLQLEMGTVNTDFQNTLASIDGIKLHNPPGFQDPLMVDIPLVYVDYHLGDILKGNIHLQDLRLHLKELLVIRNKDGKLNLDYLKAATAAKKGEVPPPAEQAPAPAEQKKGPGIKVQIDKVDLKVDRVIYKDYTVGNDPIVQTFDVNISEQHENITNPQTLVTLIVAKALRNTTIARLTNLNSEFLQSNVFDTMTMANQAANNVASQLEGKVTGTGGALVGKLGGEGQVVEDKAKALFGSLKNKLPVGNGSQTQAQSQPAAT
ncbi:MAG TPA: hypothetical protein VL688_03985 [Verrucomicrobiae bacterium]|jgi:hypothetical protein|nr:hypothetical protein [Verrucomicrobiae bacterium]